MDGVGRACGLLAALLLIGRLFAGTPSAARADDVSHCVLARSGNDFVGSCGAFMQQLPRMRFGRTAASSRGKWRADARPIALWSGDMTDSGYSHAPLLLEIYRDGAGVLRTEYGWYPVRRFRADSSLQFDLDASREVAPNALDRAIVVRAAQLLAAPAVWNRSGSANCPARARARSLYCAMVDAMMIVTGGYDHRRPALEVVRAVIDERTANRNYHHRMMDFNDDPATTFGDVRAVLHDAVARTSDAAWLRQHGFATPG